MSVGFNPTEEYQRNRNILRRTFAGPDGEEALAVLREYCGFDGDEIAEFDSANETFFNLGKRDVFLHIKEMIAFDQEEKDE